MVKKLIFVVFAAVVVLTSTCKFSVTHAYVNEPDGFRDVVWGMSVSDMKGQLDMKGQTKDYGGMQVYTRASDSLEIGTATVRNIEYAFWRGRLYSVTINYSGYDNSAALYQALKYKFGAAHRPNRYMEKYVWYDGVTTHIYLDYSEVSNKGGVVFMSKRINDEMDAWLKSSNKGAGL